MFLTILENLKFLFEDSKILISWIGTVISNFFVWFFPLKNSDIEGISIVFAILAALLTIGYTVDRWISFRKDKKKQKKKESE